MDERGLNAHEERKQNAHQTVVGGVALSGEHLDHL